MKIAIIGPSPVPFTVGGVENLLWGLCETINQCTPHQAELIKLPSRENTFWDLIDTYYQFYKLDLSHFDAVICTKYPAWMVQHKNCLYYILHRLRGLYDTYCMTKLPLTVKRGNANIDSILDYMDSNPNPYNLDQFFNQVLNLKNLASTIPAEYFSFPGAFIRALVHYMDDYSMGKNHPSKCYTIAQTVKSRKEYFPSDTNIHVVYPPSFLKKFTFGDYKYIFMVSRLDGPKRIDMLLQAMKYVNSDIQLFIAGTGPQEMNLKRIAEHDSRIHFLGFINDDDVDRYYADSLVVPYFPYDEDYGLITIEAMMHKKPVITTVDAGGPTEFVVNNETGFITKFDAESIAEKINFFIGNPNEAIRMGENAYQKVKNITWINTVNELLSDVDKCPKVSCLKIQSKKRDKITLASTYSIYPPKGGGQARIYNLYKYLAKDYDIELISLVNADKKQENEMIAPNFREIRISKTVAHQQAEWEIEKEAGLPISDIGAITLTEKTPQFADRLFQSAKTSHLLILQQPYLFYQAKKAAFNKEIIYDSQNVEFEMKAGMLPSSKVKEVLVKRVFEVERACCEQSCTVFSCSKEDMAAYTKLYGVPQDKMLLVPNGVDCSHTHFTTPEERIKNRERLGLSGETLGVFMGSWHQPNLEACEIVFKLAQKLQHIKFLIMGSQCAFFKNKRIPSNVGLLGVTSEKVKNLVLSSVDFALNPMLSGSGTNLKMFDYMAAGIPVITTEFGARGIDDKTSLLIAEPEQMGEIVNFFAFEHYTSNIVKARNVVEKMYDWGEIAKSASLKMKKILSRNQ